MFFEVRRRKIVITEIIAFNAFFHLQSPIKMFFAEEQKGTMFKC